MEDIVVDTGRNHGHPTLLYSEVHYRTKHAGTTASVAAILGCGPTIMFIQYPLADTQS